MASPRAWGSIRQMFSRTHVPYAVIAGTIVTAGSFIAIYQHNNKRIADEPASTAQVERIASTGASVIQNPSDLHIPVEGSRVIRDTLVLAISAAGQAAPMREEIGRASCRERVQSAVVAVAW